MAWPHSTTGRGKVAFALELVGMGVFTTLKGWTPTDGWYTTAGYAAGQLHGGWLDRKSLSSWTERVSPLDGHMKVSGFTVDIVDVAGGFTALIKDWKARRWSYLTASITSTATSIPVDDLSVFSTSELGWVDGSESVFWTSTSASALELLDPAGDPDVTKRGYLGTEKRAHARDLTITPPAKPIVTDGPHTLVNRRAILHAAEVADDGTVGATEVVYRGKLGKPKAGKGLWRLPVEHVWKAVQEDAGQHLPSSALDPVGQYWYGVEGGTAGTAPEPDELSVIILERDEVVGGPSRYPIDPMLDSRNSAGLNVQWYTASDLRRYLNESFEYAYVTSGFDANVDIHGPDPYRMQCTPDAGVSRVIVREGDPLWALGFKAGSYSFDTAADDEANSYVAEDDPRALVIDRTGHHFLRPFVCVQDNSEFTDDCFAQVPGLPWAKVKTGVFTPPTPHEGKKGVEFYAGSQAWDRSWPWTSYVSIDGDSEAELRHVIVTRSDRNDTLSQALQRLTGNLASQPEPLRWMIAGLRYEDVDWDELDDALGGITPLLNASNATVTEGTKLWDILGQAFGALGVCPRITDNGKVGFSRLTTPTALGASSVLVDNNIWEAMNAAQVEATLGDVPVVNSLQIRHTFDYRSGEWADGFIKIIWRDGWNSILESRALVAECPGWKIGEAVGAAGSTYGGWTDALEPLVDATHFGIFGRLATNVQIPCTWTAKQLSCMDVVKVTHELVPDMAEGAIGVSDRLGLIVGRTVHPTRSGEDRLFVRIPRENRAKGIAPCALMTDWPGELGPTNTATFASSGKPKYAQAGTDDLASFQRAGVSTPVLLQIYNSTGYQEWQGVLNSSAITEATGGDAGEAVFIGDPFGGSAMPATGAYMTLPAYSDSVAWQQDYCYLASTATVPVLHDATSTVPADEWSI